MRQRDAIVIDTAALLDEDVDPEASQAMLDSIVYWDDEEPPFELGPGQFGLVVAARRRAGRPLTRAEVISVVSADGGEHRDR